MPTDQELISSYFDGEERAFAQLVERHIKAVHGFASRFSRDQNEAEDIVQESFLKAWRQLRAYDGHKGRFKAWLMSIVRNTAIDHARKKKHTAFSEFDTRDGEFAETLLDEAPLPDEIVAKKGDVVALEQALHAVPEAHREILLLYNGNDFTFEEIATILNASVNTIKSRYRRALAALREVLMHPNGDMPRI